MGPYLSMEMFSYVSLVPNILFMVLFSLIPESPYHYALHGSIDEAEASLKWFRREADVKAEMQELQDFVDGASTSVLTKLKNFLLPGILEMNYLIEPPFFLNFEAYAWMFFRKHKIKTTQRSKIRINIRIQYSSKEIFKIHYYSLFFLFSTLWNSKEILHKTNVLKIQRWIRWLR